MVLDLWVRGRTGGKRSLDDVMRAMYEEFYLKSQNNSYYLRGRGYQPEDLQRVASQVAGMNLGDFFDRYVRRTEPLPYDEALGYAGLRLNKKAMKDPFNAGLMVDYEERTAFILTVRNDSPAENAGLQSGDEIVEVGGKGLVKDNWPATISRFKPGQSVPVTVKRDRRTLKVNLVLGDVERFEYKIEELMGATAEQKKLRTAWLEGK